MEVWASNFSFFASIGFARRDNPNNESLTLLTDDANRSCFAIAYIDRNVWYRLRVEDIRHVGQPHAAVTRQHLQTEQGCFCRKPRNRSRAAIPAQREVVKVEMSDVSLNGDAIQLLASRACRAKSRALGNRWSKMTLSKALGAAALNPFRGSSGSNEIAIPP